MKIAVLAWGSLTWDQRELAIEGDFWPRGPRLPIEFSRISGNGRLTLVIDQAFGVACTTYAAQSKHTDLVDAIENLRLRERMPGSKGIGFMVPASGKQSATAKDRHPHALSTIATWTRTSGHEAVIWTALASNFREKTNEPFSVKAGIRHLEKLEDPIRSIAPNYIRRAPLEVQTPLRSAGNLRWPEDSSNNTIEP